MMPRGETAWQIRKALIYMGTTIGGRTEPIEKPSNAAAVFDGSVKSNGRGTGRVTLSADAVFPHSAAQRA